MDSLEPVSLEAVHAAAERLKPVAVRTPLIPLNVEDAPAEIYLKLENLQPIGAFKIRPAGNAILNAPQEIIADGVYTASSGNMAQGIAYTARMLGIPASVLLPEDAASNKVQALQRLGAEIRYLPDSEWWQVLTDHGHEDVQGHFIHPVADADVIAGDATVGLEIFEDLPSVETVVVPFGGGGLSTGIASALKALGSNARVLGAESNHCEPLAAAFDAGSPVEIPVQPSFVSGLGVGRVLEEMWPLISTLIDSAVMATAEEIVDVIRLLYERHHFIVEGAGATPVAAALAGRAGPGKVVCVISGGNLNTSYLIDILNGKMPQL
ncbi:MAG: threonine/serine dehydratase [Gammaproteobacteria bacterium]